MPTIYSAEAKSITTKKKNILTSLIRNQLGYILRKGVDSTIPVHAESTSESLPKKAEKLRKEESQDELTVLMNEVAFFYEVKIL